MKIPIENIYYILCYAWDKLEEKELIKVEPTSTTNLVNLFARVLISGTNHLLKRGFDRGYILDNEETRRLRGKIDFNSTLKRSLLIKGQVQCEFDELDYNVLHNRILKTTMKNLVQVDGLDKELQKSLIQHLHRLHEVEEINLSKKIFNKVQLHSNNYFYDFLLKICELLYDNLLPTQKTGTWQFRNFLRDENKMPAIFENFVRNFYKSEAKGYKVNREDIYWNKLPVGNDSINLLPKMQTDICLTSKNRKIMIECKYTSNLFQEHYGTKKFRSEHLYQLNSYLHNLPNNHLNNTCQAILLYPSLDNMVNKDYKDSKGRIISIRTVDLNQNWPNIHHDLLELIGN